MLNIKHLMVEVKGAFLKWRKTEKQGYIQAPSTGNPIWLKFGFWTLGTQWGSVQN